MAQQLALGDDSLLRAEDGVLELFARVVTGSYRIPVGWVAVELEPRKHDMVRVRIGTRTAGADLYSSPAFMKGEFNFEIAAADESALRAFLDSACA